MRHFVAASCTAFLLLAFSVPASGQLHLVGIAGLDLDWEGLSIGVGAELPLNLDIVDNVSTSGRGTIEYVFAGDRGRAGSYSVIRAEADLIGAINLGGSSSLSSLSQIEAGDLQPYVKAGLIIERFSFEWDNDVPIVGGDSFSNTEIGVALGGGVNFNQLFGELTLGVGNVSNLRLTAGYKFAL